MTSVILVAKAAQQLQERDAWWRDHRPDAVTLVADEFERCVELLKNTPALGAPFRKTSVFGVRRLVMKKTKHLVYYVHDSAHSAPAGLPDGEVDLCLADPDDEMNDDELARLDEALARGFESIKAGRFRSAAAVVFDLRRR